MDKARINLKLTFFLVFMVLNPKMIKCQTSLYPTTPLCMTQFALANHACGLLPYSPRPPHHPPPHPPLPPCPPDHHGDHDHCGGDEDHDHDHDHDHDDNRHHNENGHRHGHGHRHHHHESPIEKECCRWLKEMDGECVCDLLVRLPPFLSKPGHAYTVVVGESCHLTFECGGRLRV